MILVSRLSVIINFMDNLLLVQHICNAQFEIQIYQIIIICTPSQYVPLYRLLHSWDILCMCRNKHHSLIPSQLGPRWPCPVFYWSQRKALKFQSPAETFYSLPLQTLLCGEASKWLPPPPKNHREKGKVERKKRA